MDIRLKKTPMEFDGKTFELCCNMNALADVQEQCGGEISTALSGKSTLKSVLMFLSAMLNDYADEHGLDVRYTPKQVGRILKPNELDKATSVVMELVTDAIKSDEQDEEAEKN